MRFFKHWTRYVTLGGILLAMAVCGFGLFVISGLSFSAVPAASGPQMTIVPASTYTPTPGQTGENGSSPTQTDQASDGIQIGVYVQITGTDGTGLRIRSNPGLNADIQFLGMDNEVFVVKDGPIEADDYTWWYLESPYDANRSGWSASEFLAIIEQ